MSLPPLILWANHPPKYDIERKRCPIGVTPINAVISVSDSWSTFADCKHPKICCLSFLCLHSLIFPATVFLSALNQQLFDALIFQGLSQSIQVSRPGMFWYFLLTRLLKSGAFVVRCWVPLISHQSCSKMILKWQNELLLLQQQRLDKVCFCIHLGGVTAS